MSYKFKSNLLMTKSCGNDPAAVLVGWMCEGCRRTQVGFMGAASLPEIGEGAYDQQVVL